MYGQETETPVNDAQAAILADQMGLGGVASATSNPNNHGVNASFLGQSPLRWFLFVGMLLLWLWLWGRIVKYLGGHE